MSDLSLVFSFEISSQMICVWPMLSILHLFFYFENRPVNEVHARSWIKFPNLNTAPTPWKLCIGINETLLTPKTPICIFQSFFLLSNIINPSNLFSFKNKITPFTKRTIRRYKIGVPLTLSVRFICILVGKICSFSLLYDISLCRYTLKE